MSEGICNTLFFVVVIACYIIPTGTFLQNLRTFSMYAFQPCKLFLIPSATNPSDIIKSVPVEIQIHLPKVSVAHTIDMMRNILEILSILTKNA